VEVEYLLIALITLAACFTQTVSGFGSALVAMPLLSSLLGLQRAAPVMALLAGTLQIFLLIRYRKAMNFTAVWRLSAGSMLGIPLGIYALSHVPEAVTVSILGVVLVVYALYSLTHPKMPELKSTLWAWLTGLLAGMLGGAYNTNGPPAVVYGDCRRWPPEEFKSNLQGFFMVNNIVILASHAFKGNLTVAVWWSYLAGLPGLALGLIAGLLLARKINPGLFRKIMLGMVVLLGSMLLLKAAHEIF
jgi:uncharacterized protein